MIQASEHQSRWKTPGLHFRFELRLKCGFAQAHMHTRAHTNSNSLHPTTAFNRCLSKQKTRIILKDRWNLTMQSNPSFCCNVIKWFSMGQRNDNKQYRAKTLVIALYNLCRRIWKASIGLEVKRWDSKCDESTTIQGKNYVMNVFYSYIVPQSSIFRLYNGAEPWM